MVIAVDIDDVLYPFADTVIPYVHKMSGKHVTPLELFGDQKMTASGLSDTDFIRIVSEYHFEPENIHHKPLNGVLEHLTDLAIDNDVYLVTSRVHSMKNVTEQWVSMHLPGVPLKELIFVGNHWNGRVTETKAEVCKRIKADFLIEDQPRYVDMFINHPTQAILFGEYDWNRNHAASHFTRAKDWFEVRKIITRPTTT